LLRSLLLARVEPESQPDLIHLTYTRTRNRR